MKFNLFGSRKDAERTEKRIMESGGLRLRTKIAKDITGDQSASVEFDIQGDRGPKSAEPIRLGDARVMPNILDVLDYRVERFDTGTGTASDNFLRGVARDGYIGGAERGYRPGFVEREAGTPGTYAYSQPNADARDVPNPFADPEGGDGIADASDPNFPGAGQIGGREPSSYTVKQMNILRAMYDETDDEDEKKALKAAFNALAKSASGVRTNTLKSGSGAGTWGRPGDPFDQQPMPVAKRRGLFSSLLTKRQAGRNADPGTVAADNFFAEQ